eukprot:06239.XXX_25198_26442_1 [CDS] Oithona nana genome sequencing.
MGLTCNTIVLRTPAGILKIFEFVLVFICLMLARFGNDGDIMRFARNSFGSDLTFMGIGTLVGYAIIVPSILCTYLMGANLTFLELFINFVGGILFILTGTFTFVEARKGYKNDAEMALGILCIIAGVIFLVDFIVSVRNSRVTVVRTTRTVV